VASHYLCPSQAPQEKQCLAPYPHCRQFSASKQASSASCLLVTRHDSGGTGWSLPPHPLLQAAIADFGMSVLRDITQSSQTLTSQGVSHMYCAPEVSRPQQSLAHLLLHLPS
jgi:hypothetical protein